tara:strand:- start:130 stop:531 length:402 start_codon:yes stop_codon:yes gene_type:complete
MSFKLLTNELPIEIVKLIHEYDNTYSLLMKNVINEIDKLNKDVEEYWYVDEYLYYMSDEEEIYRLKLGLSVSPLDWPLPNKRCFRFWNKTEIDTTDELSTTLDYNDLDSYSSEESDVQPRSWYNGWDSDWDFR